jgi:hypothetical protein
MICFRRLLLLLIVAGTSCHALQFPHGKFFGMGTGFLRALFGCFMSEGQICTTETNTRIGNGWIYSPRIENATIPKESDLCAVIASYNVLADCYAQKCTRDPHIALWSLRKGAILAEIEKLDADILCLQEVGRI